MGVKQSSQGRFTTIEKIYDRILYYRDKPGTEFLMKEYHRATIDSQTIMSFVSPTGVSLLRKNDDGLLYNEMITVDEAIKLLSPYLRKQKLMKIMK